MYITDNRLYQIIKEELVKEGILTSATKMLMRELGDANIWNDEDEEDDEQEHPLEEGLKDYALAGLIGLGSLGGVQDANAGNRIENICVDALYDIKHKMDEEPTEASLMKYKMEIDKYRTLAHFRQDSYCVDFADKLIDKIRKREVDIHKGMYYQFASDYHRLSHIRDLEGLQNLLTKVKSYISENKIGTNNKQWDNLRCNIARKIVLFKEAYD